ncbi:MAG TPA: glycosyltransferase family 39 protein, partial [Vicinamibacteria bacterium]|nr:glycosyltransferase family 39 protein [Vicinamibacteria bacterium]
MVLIVLGGGALRFAGLGWGLRHPVHTDERVYVDNVVTMVEARDLDHRFYTYPALFYYILAPGIALLGHARRLGPDAYWISRGLVAFVGTGNILLAYVVASRLFGRAAGLATSLFLAVSPVDIRTSHQVRPDILLEGFGLAALLVFRNVGEDLRWDSRAGMLMGLATAIKFTGLLLLPFYLGARLLAPGPRLRGGARAALLAAALPVLLTPYAVLHYARYQKGPSEQLSMYYKEPGAEPRFWKNVAFYGEDGLHALGPLTALLVLGGLALGLARDPRGWAPRLLYPLTTLVVMSTPVLVFPRLILPAMGVIYALAGLPVEALARRHRTLAVLLALLAAAFPLRGSLRYVNLVARPSAADQALDWLVAHVPPGSRILETRPEGADPGREAGAMLGIDPARYEILYHP